MVMMMMTMTIALVLILFSLHLIALAPSTQNAPLPRMPSSPTSWTLRSLSRPFPLPPTTPRSTPAAQKQTLRGTACSLHRPIPLFSLSPSLCLPDTHQLFNCAQLIDKIGLFVQCSATLDQCSAILNKGYRLVIMCCVVQYHL